MEKRVNNIMSENSKMFLTKSIIIHCINQKQYDVLVDVSSKLNCTVETFKMVKTSVEEWKLEEDYIELPLSKIYNKTMKDKSYRPKIKIPDDIREKTYPSRN